MVRKSLSVQYANSKQSGRGEGEPAPGRRG
jgi:hypothetical protein